MASPTTPAAEAAAHVEALRAHRELVALEAQRAQLIAQRAAAIRALHAAGWSAPRIATLLGVTKQRVGQLLAGPA